jgi:NADH dehydrogenase [ubiquinone] 1 alpha subcomplex assembly factor 8
MCKSAAYGKCIAKDYNNVFKDKCLTEFLKLQQCYTVFSHLDPVGDRANVY